MKNTAPRFAAARASSASRSRGKPDSPAARECAQAHGKCGLVVRADRSAPTARCRSDAGRIDAHDEEIEEIDIADVDIDDPAFESLLVGRKVKVLLGDVDLIRWKQDLFEDRNRLATLLSAANAGRCQTAMPSWHCAKHGHREQMPQPDQRGNRKIIVFTAFADTAQYLYANWRLGRRETLGIEPRWSPAQAGEQTTFAALRKDMGTILTCVFAPLQRAPG
jgi:hypothetical protein